jgi:oligoribonuclease NrnB/cAMP/cGMP phosphodiesterase (DHH superfamily)
MKQYLVLDHHKSAEKELKQVPEPNKIFDMNHSGCAMAWQYFYPGWTLPYILKMVEARDLWKHHNIPDANEYLAGLHRIGYCAGCWFPFFQDDKADELIRDGTILEDNRRKAVKFYVRNAQARTWQGHNTWVVNVTDPTAVSDTGATLTRNNQDLALMWRYDMEKKTYNCSLRSGPDGPDVSVLARATGEGGGHMHAAGFIFRGQCIEELFVSE